MAHECRRFAITEAGGFAWRQCVECGRKERGKLVNTHVAGGPESEALQPQPRRED
jgi:hypothetical protein